MPKILDQHARQLIVQKLVSGDMELTYGREDGNVVHLTAKPTIIGRAHAIAAEITAEIANQQETRK